MSQLKTKKRRPPRITCEKCKDGPYAGQGWYLKPAHNGIHEGVLKCQCYGEIQKWKREAATGLPPLFERALVANWEPLTEDHLRLRSWVIEFVKGWTAESGKGILALGCVGSGKSHLTAAVMKALMADHDLEGRYISTEVLYRDLRSSFSDPGEESEGRLLRSLEKVDLLLLDDLGVSGSEYKRQVLYQIINARANHSRPILASSNLDLDHLEEAIDPRSVSRLLQCCEVLHFPKIDHRRPEVAEAIEKARRPR